MSAYSAFAGPAHASPIAAVFEGARAARIQESGDLFRAVVYVSGPVDWRPGVVEVVLKWAADQGYEVVAKFEDNLGSGAARYRVDLGTALRLVEDARAEVLLIPLMVYAQLGGADQEWLKAACEKFGGRLETVPMPDVELVS